MVNKLISKPKRDNPKVEDKLIKVADKKKLKNKKQKEQTKSSDYPSLDLKSDRDIALDFAEKVYQKFDKLIKSVVLFGSSVKNLKVPGSDIDIILIVDDATVRFDEKLILWYREELGKIIQENPYKKELHINTIRLTTWWEDLIRGDPTLINIIRYGDAVIDSGGFFNPFKILLQKGKIKITPESMYTILNRVPEHLARSKYSELNSVDGCYWAFVESAQALLMAANVTPPSPEHITSLLKEHFVDKKLLKDSYLDDFVRVYEVHKKIIHGEVKDIDGKLVDEFQNKADDFFKTAVRIINQIIK